MARKKNENYVCAVFLTSGKMLFVRDLGPDGHPLSGFHFPGGECANAETGVAELRQHMKRKYGVAINVIAPLPAFTILRRDGVTITLNPYRCQNKEALKFPRYNFQHRYLGKKDIANFFIDPADRAVAEKAFLFLPLFEGKRRKVALLPKEQAEVALYLDSLIFFKQSIPANEISDFSLLIGSDATLAEIRLAYKWILSTYHCDYNEYLDELDYQKSRRI